MTTSAQQITNLIGSNTALKAYFEGQKGTWDDQVQDAKNDYNDLAEDLRSVTAQNLFIDQISGDDANNGSIGSPVASVKQALELEAEFGTTSLFFLSNYTETEAIDFNYGRYQLRSYDTENQVTLKFAAVATNAADVPAQFRMRYSANTLLMNSIKLEAAPPDAAVTGANAMFVIGSGASLSLRESEIILPAGSTQTVLSLQTVGSLSVSGVITPAEMPGRWITGAAAASDPAAIPKLAGCSLSSL